MTKQLWENAESSLGILYDLEYPELPAKILIAWEHEWLKNAPAMYWFDAGEVWAKNILPMLMAGTLTPEDREDLLLYAPHMTANLRALPISLLTSQIRLKILNSLA